MIVTLLVDIIAYNCSGAHAVCKSDIAMQFITCKVIVIKCFIIIYILVCS